jgi:hypothetical protein
MGLNGLIPKEFEKKYAENMKKINLGGNGLDCLSYLAGNSHDFIHIIFLNSLGMKTFKHMPSHL